METILMIKRKPCGEFTGDATWQVAPYTVKNEQGALRIVEWLRKSSLADFEYRVVEA